jgi:glucose-1-phosphate thymidylyltransferase
VKVIIPLAGKGTRLRPHTHVTPKPMLRVAGKPVMQYIIDDLKALGGLDEVIYITGHLKEKVEEYARRALPVKSTFIEQTVQDGTAGAVALAKPRVDQPVLIIFVDTIFDADLSVIQGSTDDGIIWTKEVEDYQRFGVVVTDANGHMTKIVEKPVLDVGGWYDAGKIDTLLDTNRVMLEKGRAQMKGEVRGGTVVDPVYVESGVTIINSTVGPNVSISKGSVVENSTVRDAVVGENAKIVSCDLSSSLIGDDVVLDGVKGSVTVGDHSEVRARG